MSQLSQSTKVLGESMNGTGRIVWSAAVPQAGRTAWPGVWAKLLSRKTLSATSSSSALASRTGAGSILRSELRK